MFGYACKETDELMPLPIMLAHRITKRLAEVRKADVLPYLRPDGKAQVTVALRGRRQGRQRAAEIVSVLVSTQHRDGLDADTLIKPDLIEHVLRPDPPQGSLRRKRFEERDFVLVNPTGKFVVGGPMGDTGLTGRKIIVDSYGGSARHGGGPSRERPDEGRPLRSVRRPLCRQERRRRRPGRPLRAPDRLRDRRRPPGFDLGRVLRNGGAADEESRPWSATTSISGPRRSSATST